MVHFRAVAGWWTDQGRWFAIWQVDDEGHWEWYGWAFLARAQPPFPEPGPPPEARGCAKRSRTD